MRMLRSRFLDMVLSMYLYNEYQGYTQLNRLVEMLERRYPEDRELVEAVKKHAADERKHYVMFTGYFQNEKRMPFNVRREIGYFDMLVRVIFGKWTCELEESRLVGDARTFARMCRIIVMTEYRGIKQVGTMLKWKSVKSHDRLRRIFSVIEKDEPSHFIPYREWLERNDYSGPSFRERAVDLVVHYGIALFVFPVLFLNPRLQRMEAFPA